MALNSTLISSSIFTQLNLIGFKGRDIFKLSEVIGNSLSIYLKTPNIISCFLSGSSGASGTITNTGITGLSFYNMSTFMYNKALMFGFNGVDLKKFFDAISKGICTSLLSISVIGSVVGVGVGGGIGNFTAINENALFNLLSMNMLQKNFIGRDSKNICSCIAFGIINHLRTMVQVPVVVTGVVSPIPPITVTGIPAIYIQIN
jgi:hypothetical protein